MGVYHETSVPSFNRIQSLDEDIWYMKSIWLKISILLKNLFNFLSPTHFKWLMAHSISMNSILALIPDIINDFSTTYYLSLLDHLSENNFLLSPFALLIAKRKSVWQTSLNINSRPDLLSPIIHLCIYWNPSFLFPLSLLWASIRFCSELHFRSLQLRWIHDDELPTDAIDTVFLQYR